MRRRHPLPATLTLSLLISGCAAYHPLPLGTAAGDDLSLASVQAVLSRDARTIDRPYLTPTTIDLSQPLDANAISVIAVVGSPDLKGMRVRAGVAEAQVFAARLIPDPTLSIGVSKVLSGPDSLLDLTSALGQDINALRTRGARLAAARAQAEQVRLDLAWAEWQAAGQARIQAVRLQSLQRISDLARASFAATTSLLDRTLQAAGRGDLSADQVQAARLSAYSAKQQLRTSERDLAAARFELTRLLGLPPTTELMLAPAAIPAPPPSAEHAVRAGASRAFRPQGAPGRLRVAGSERAACGPRTVSDVDADRQCKPRFRWQSTPRPRGRPHPAAVEPQPRPDRGRTARRARR